MSKKIKHLISFLFITCLVITLSACSNHNKATKINSNSSLYTNNSKIAFYHGDVDQTAGIFTVPILMQNNSDDDTQVKSNNFTLLVDKKRIKPIEVDSEPTDYHDAFKAGGNWKNIVSFYLGTKIKSNQMSKVTLLYKLDNGKEIAAKAINLSKINKLLGSENVNLSEKSLGEYYSDMKDYQKNQNGESTSGSSSNTLEDQFNDSKYDNLHTWITASTKFPNSIVLKVQNDTNTDFNFVADELELVNKNGQEIQIAPNYYNFAANIPHDKYLTITLPLEAKLNKNDGPYTVRFKNNNSSNNSDSSYESTKSTPYPVEMVLNDADDYTNLYTATPDQIGTRALQFSNIKLSYAKKTLTATINNDDYYNLKMAVNKFTLVGVDKDGTVGDEQVPIAGNPTTVRSREAEQLKLKFKSFTTLKTYKKIVLKYNNQTLFNIK